MNRKIILKQLENKLKLYELNKLERTLYYQQAFEAISSCSDEELDEYFDVQEIIDEVFELNNVTPKKKVKKYNFGKALIGLALIVSAFLLVFTSTSIYVSFILVSISLALSALINRHLKTFILFLFISLAALNSLLDIFANITFFRSLLAIIILWIGLKFIFPNDYTKKQKRQARKGYRHQHSHNETKHQYANNFTSTSSYNNESEVFMIKNNFGGNQTDLHDEAVNYIDIENRFGGVELDMTKFTFKDGDVTIHFENVFGGVQLYINSKTRIVNLTENILGGVSFNSESRDFEKTIYLKGKNVFGGIDVMEKE